MPWCADTVVSHMKPYGTASSIPYRPHTRTSIRTSTTLCGVRANQTYLYRIQYPVRWQTPPADRLRPPRTILATSTRTVPVATTRTRV
eukprot:scaffold224452_cov30-Prasinocladus_malaysianus.AAC.1